MSHKHDCHKFLQSISDLIDGELPAEICKELDRHLAECPDCRIVFNTTKKTVELYHDDPVEASLPSSVRERLFLRLHLEDYCK